MNLTYTASHDNILLTWLPGNDSMQDSYFVWYRARLHGDYSQWMKNISSDTRIELTSLFPGLMYEMVVFAVSHSEMSPPSVVSALMCKVIVQRSLNDPKIKGKFLKKDTL